jgi:hypothetical protein
VSSKKVELKFNFNNPTPQIGDPNKYTNLAPGVSLATSERLKNSMRAERFEVYEDTFKQIADLIGTVRFDEFNLATKDQNIGKTIESLLLKISQTNERIDSGSFPIDEIAGRSVMRSYGLQIPLSPAIIDVNSDVPGAFDFNPEFEISEIKGRTITMFGGKTITSKAVANASIVGDVFQLEVAAPVLHKNIEFDITQNIYPKSVWNLVELKWDSGTGTFIGKIPVRRSSNGLPYNLPIEPGQFQGLGSDTLDIQVVWYDNTTDRLLSDSSTDPSNRDVMVVYLTNSDELYLKVKPSVFLNANPDPSASDTSKKLSAYIFYYLPAWRYDYIVATPDGGLTVAQGNDLSENTDFSEVEGTFLYQVLVSCWDELSANLTNSEDWFIKSELKPISHLSVQKQYETDPLQRVFNVYPKNITRRNNWKTTKNSYLIPRKGKIASERGVPITKSQISTEFGIAPPIKNPNDSIVGSKHRVYLISDEWVDIDYPGLTDLLGTDFERGFTFEGISFLLYKADSLDNETKLTELSSPMDLEYQVLEEGNIVFHAKTHYPQSGVAETVVVRSTTPIKLSSTNTYVLKVKINNGIVGETYFIKGETENEIGRSIQVHMFQGLGLRGNTSQFQRLTADGPTGESGILSSSAAFNLSSSLVGSLSEYSYAFSIDERVGCVSFSHDTLNTDTNGNRYVKCEINWGYSGDTSKKGKTIQYIDFSTFGELNSASNTTELLDAVFTHKAGQIHFALLFRKYAGALSESTESNAIMVGTIIPTLSKPVAVSKFIGNNDDYTTSSYGTSKILKQAARYYGTRGRQLSLDCDEDGNTAVVFIGKLASGGDDTVDVFFLDAAKRIRGTVRETFTNALYEQVRVVCTTGFKGSHSGIVILKKTISSLLSEYNLRLYEPLHHNTEAETVAILKDTGTISIVTDTNDSDQTNIVAISSSKSEDNKQDIVKLLLSITNISADNILQSIDVIVRDSQLYTGSIVEVVSSIPRNVNNKHFVDSNEITTSGIDGGITKVQIFRNGTLTHTLTGRTDVRYPNLFVREKQLLVYYYSSDYIASPYNDFDLVYEASTDTFEYIRNAIDLENTSLDQLFLGFYTDEGEEIQELERIERNIILDPHITSRQWVYGNAVTPTTVELNRSDLSLADGEIARYTVEDSEHDYLHLSRLNGQILCVTWDSYVSGDTDGIYENIIDVKVYNASNHYYPLIKKVNGVAWFYIDQDPGASLKIQFTNNIGQSIRFHKTGASTGWIPLLIPEWIEWQRKRHGSLRVDDTTTAASAVHPSGAAISTAGGISAAKDVKIGQTLEVDGTSQFNDTASMAASKTVVLGRDPVSAMEAVTLQFISGFRSQQVAEYELTNGSSQNLGSDSTLYQIFIKEDPRISAMVKYETSQTPIVQTEHGAFIENSDVASNFCIYRSGTDLIIKNNLGATRTAVVNKLYTA